MAICIKIGNVIQINEKPLSCNEQWQGKRFKTTKYRGYEELLLLTLPSLKIPEKPLKVMFEFGFSNKCSDIDNCVKSCLDILCKKYGFDDRDIYRLEVTKVIVPAKKEYTKFEIQSL